MSVVKIKKRETPYILIDKKGVRDPRLSWKATGLLTYLIGLPEDWKIRLNNLATCKIDGLTACKSALRELREYNYCHYFEVRKSGKVVETFYIVYEVPTPYSEELKEDLFLTEDIDSTYDLFYKSVKKSETKKQNKEEKSEEKVIEEELGKKEIKIEKPKVENQLSVKKAKNEENQGVSPKVENPLSDNHLLLNNNSTKEIINNTTNTRKDEKKISSSYDFLNFPKYSRLNKSTVNNIKNNIENLTEEKFEEIYNLTEKYINSGKGQNFDAILYKALLNEWNFDVMTTENKIVQDEKIMFLKKKWLSHFSGLDKELKEEISNIIKYIPLETLNKNKSKLSKMTIFEFKQYLLILKKQEVA